MPISKSNFLFSLIKSLTRGEKRHFRSFALRESEGGALKYLQLFEILEKQEKLNEEELIRQINKTQLPNLKRHLYTQIMISLRLQKQKENVSIQLREYLDFANILYSKGLYLQSLQIIEKAKKMAIKINDELILIQLLEFGKIIETRHITRSGTDRVTHLTDHTDELLENLNNRLKLSNLRIRLHSSYIEYGHVSSNEDAQVIKDLYLETLEKIKENDLGLIERAYYYQSRVWYHFILWEMEQCYESAALWLDLFKIEGKYLHRDTNLMMRAYHYILTALYHLGDIKMYVKYLDEFENFRYENYKKFNRNSQIISFIYAHNGRLNKYILTQKYQDGLPSIPKTLARIKKYKKNLDSHRILVLYYKIAILYILAGNADKAIKYLFNIINNKLGNLREDIQGYARLAFLMAHYDIKNYDVIERELPSIQKYFSKISLDISTTELTLNFFKTIIDLSPFDKKSAFRKFTIDLHELSKNKYERRGLLYLNILEWAERKH